ncbi:MAG: hypothetical protein F9K44_02105 [Hyphomicrobiaceae bacterium]|nr:MAG: hypothetical protein F9K44_02105 [Hyphomicrobiaceae bacterium]
MVNTLPHLLDPRSLAAPLMLGLLAWLALAPAGAAERYLHPLGVEMPAEAASKDLCELKQHRVFVETSLGSECIAYYPTSRLKGADHAIFYLDGDVPSEMAKDKRVMERFLTVSMLRLEVLAAEHNLPFIYIGRPGVFGSSGNHAKSKRVREFRILEAAIDAIKARHGLKTISLAGQSGGSTAIAALLTFGRTDVRCAVPASGSYAVFERLDRLLAKAGRRPVHRMSPEEWADYYDIMRNIGGIARQPARKIIIVGDPADTITPFDLQKRFSETLAENGHHAVLVASNARDRDHHGLGHIAMAIAGACARGLPDSELVRIGRSP